MPQLDGKEVCCVKLVVEFADALGAKETFHFSFPHKDFSTGNEQFTLDITEGEESKSNVCLHLIGANDVLKGMKRDVDGNSQANQ